MTSLPALLTEVDGCLADLQGLHSSFPNDDVIVSEWSQMKRLRMWVERQADDHTGRGAHPATDGAPAIGGGLPAARVQHVLAALATTVADSPSDRSLDGVPELAWATVPGCAGVGVGLWDVRATVTLSATSPVVRILNDSKTAPGEGPLPDALDARTARVVPDPQAETRWPRFATHAAGLGGAGAMALPLLVEAGEAGASSVYIRDVRTLTADTQRLVLRHAEYVSAELRRILPARVLSDSLERCRDVGRAVGILMECFELTYRQGTELLTRACQVLDTEPHALAVHLLREGTVPGARQSLQPQDP